MGERLVIIPISSNQADLAAMIAAVAAQTGDNKPFFCPQVIEGISYDDTLMHSRRLGLLM